MKKSMVILFAVALVIFGVTNRTNAYNISTFSPNGYPYTDSELGIDGLTIEDFEDAFLAEGLTLMFGIAHEEPTHPFSSGDILNNAAISWDGSQLLKSDAGFYSVYFDFAQPITSFGIGFSAASADIDIVVNKNDADYVLNDIGNFGDFVAGGGRNLYFRIDAIPGDPLISSIRIDTGTIWGFSGNYDHVAFSPISPATPVPEPATMLLLGSGLVGLAGLRRKLRK